MFLRIKKLLGIVPASYGEPVVEAEPEPEVEPEIPSVPQDMDPKSPVALLIEARRIRKSR